MKELFWNYGETGAKISLATSAIGTFLSYKLGGWDSMIKALVMFMALDFILGFLASCKAKKTDSKVMFWGGVNKILVLILVYVGVQLDNALSLPEPFARTAIIWFYIGREGLSVVENYGKMGLPLPKFISTVLEQLKDKGDNANVKIK